MGVDLVVVNYRTPDDLIAFLHSFQHVRDEVDCTLTVVNVDPAAEDELVAKIGADYPVFQDSFDTNVGYATACNEAFGALEGFNRTIAFFNADTRLKPGVLKTLDDELWAHDDWGIIGPRQIDDYGKITAGGIFGTNEQPSFAGRWQANDNGQFNDIRDDCVSVSGSAYFVKRPVWKELTDCTLYQQQIAPGALGAFLPTQHYYEETWCSYHARFHGWKVVYYGPTVMTHLWHKASPLGGIGEQVMPMSQEYFRSACDKHGIKHD